MLVSITRLRLRSPRFQPSFLWGVLGVNRQTVRAPGFRGGMLIMDAHRTFWTVTAWNDEAAMRAYRNGGAHRRVMPRLADWCDEASVTRWTQESDALPDVSEVHRRMVTEGRASPLTHPSPNHAALRLAAPVVRAETPLTPRAAKSGG